MPLPGHITGSHTPPLPPTHRGLPPLPCAVDEMLVKISSLVGANPDWHTGDPLTISFKKVAAGETVRALWDKVPPPPPFPPTSTFNHLKTQ